MTGCPCSTDMHLSRRRQGHGRSSFPWSRTSSLGVFLHPRPRMRSNLNSASSSSKRLLAYLWGNDLMSSSLAKSVTLCPAAKAVTSRGHVDSPYTLTPRRQSAGLTQQAQPSSSPSVDAADGRLPWATPFQKYPNWKPPRIDCHPSFYHGSRF